MKTTGVIRKLDELGRITLPIELRRSLDLDVKDGLEITVQDDCIILKKAECADIFTGSTDDLLEYEGKKVSRQSVVALAKLAGLNVTFSTSEGIYAAGSLYLFAYRSKSFSSHIVCVPITEAAGTHPAL